MMPTTRESRNRWTPSALAGLQALIAGTGAAGAPVVDNWPSVAGAPASDVSASAVSGWYAVAETEGDTVELRDARGTLIKRLTREDLSATLGWMSLSTDSDGPSAVALSDSGRLLFIAMHDDQPAPDGFGGDAILRYDTVLDTIAVFTRTELSDTTTPAGHAGVSMAHFRGTLYVGTDGNGLQVHAAGKDATFSILPQTVGLAGSSRGLAVDRDRDLLYAAFDSVLHRASITSGTPSFSNVGSFTADARGITIATTHGSYVAGELFAGLDNGPAGSIVRVPALQAIGLQGFAPIAYTSAHEPVLDLSATACGRLLLGTTDGAKIITDDADSRLGFEEWLRDEFAQVAAFGRGLISPDGEPAGWVIDADVTVGATRFHPASPDGAAWVVLLLLMDDHLNDTADAQDLVHSILRRYAGLAADGIAPRRNADGIYKHWLNPFTGDTQPGWLDEYATLSTMKIVLAADRAKRFYPGDTGIVEAADAIIDGISGWDRYLEPGTDALFFQGASAGGPQGGAASGFHEGILFIEQAEAFGDDNGAFARWLDRNRWPSASFATGLSVTTNAAGVHLPAFVSLYSHLVQGPFRDDASWTTHIDHLLGSHGAWTDDAGPRYMTVFSAGDSGPAYGGYQADSLSDHPGDITAFPSLMAFSADGRTAPAIAAYHAYRRGARQLFESNATILYRRSEQTVGFAAPTAGLPDVALGALGIAELIEPGAVEAVLAGEYGQARCPADLATPFGVLDLADIGAFVGAFVANEAIADLDQNGVFDLADISEFVASFVNGCP
jgi:hypothetical protein